MFSFSPVVVQLLMQSPYRTLSMTLGRPASIPDSYVQVELPRHDEDLIVSGVKPQDVQMSTDFFNKTM